MTAQTFVLIAAYRDPDIGHTVQSILDTARGTVRIGIVDQGGSFASQEAHVETIRVDPCETRGAGWARYLAWSMWEGEPWSYMCDAHVRMEQDWDARLVADYESIEGTQVVLSAYPGSMSCELAGNQSIVRNLHFEGPRLVSEATIVKATGKPVLSRGSLSCSNLFVPSEFFSEVPPDPFLLFGGEEDTMALRGWTRGWDIWNPSDSLQRHDYDREGSPRLWTDYPDRTTPMDVRSGERIASIQRGETCGAWGLGSVRSVAEYESRFEVDFAARTVKPDWGGCCC